MKYSVLTTGLAVFAAGVSAFPNLPSDFYQNIPTKRSDGSQSDMDRVIAARSASPTLKAAREFSKNEGNCGLHVCCDGVFDAKKQLVSTTGQNAYQSPKPYEIRGPCPGLNAASNHNYLPRDGIASIPETIFGLGEMYSMSVELAGFLAAYSIALTGDVLTQVWSIGGPLPRRGLTKQFRAGQGLSYSHNKYEGDTSIGRMDAYLANGDAHSLNVTHFAKHAYAYGQKNGDRYTLDVFRRAFGGNVKFSVENNPYYFAPLFSTTLVAPAAYNFVINFMSNHSEAEPTGYLDGEQFKTFFAVTGKFNPKKKDYGLKWLPGQERIPDNWYKRPRSCPYDAPDVFKDLLVAWAAYPDTFRFGGNLGKTNTYTGVDIATLTGGTFSADTLFEGNNFACLLFQTQEQAVPDQLKGLINDIAGRLSLLKKFSSPIYSKLACPQLAKYDNSVFDQYPGRNYNPKGKAENY